MRIIKPSRDGKSFEVSAVQKEQRKVTEGDLFAEIAPDSQTGVQGEGEFEGAGRKRRKSKKERREKRESKDTYADIYAKGIRLLAMREHSKKELTDKLCGKTEQTDIALTVVDDLESENYQSDERFTESYVRSRANRGMGPIKIRAELNAKGVASQLIAEFLSNSSAIWFDNAERQYQKKYGDTPVKDYNDWSKRARFLQSRGFTSEHIQVAVPRVETD